MCLINYSSFVFTYNIMFVSNFELKKIEESFDHSDY